MTPNPSSTSPPSPTRPVSEMRNSPSDSGSYSEEPTYNKDGYKLPTQVRLRAMLPAFECTQWKCHKCGEMHETARDGLICTSTKHPIHHTCCRECFQDPPVEQTEAEAAIALQRAYLKRKLRWVDTQPATLAGMGPAVVIELDNMTEDERACLENFEMCVILSSGPNLYSHYGFIKMGKRKRGSNEERSRSPINFGLGATLAYLNGDNETERKTRVGADDDDEGWTVVGAHKKRQKHRDRDDRRRSSPPRHSHRRRHSSSSPDPGPASDKELESRDAETPHGFDNPFATKGNDSGEQPLRPKNPFSTKGKEAECERASEAVTSRDNISAKPRGDKLERGRERKLERHYPTIEHAHHARLQSHVKITDLQSLALYILADGHAPQWVSVKSRTSISQVVMLMVPGLELDMFSGKLALEAQPSDDGSAADTNEKGTKPKLLHVDPDDYYPAELKRHRLPSSLKPLSEIFAHVWPIKAQGEHRNNQYIKVHSPIHTMLTSQIPKTREEKQLKKSHKGPVPQNAHHWQNQRTPITEYLASLSEQQENEFVVHPAWFSSLEAKESVYQRRRAASQSQEDGWVDTKVATLEDGEIPEVQIESGSITRGRRIIAIDCEMCKAENDELVLTRVSLLNWDGSVLLDKLVKPDVTIKDYLTQWSGITEAMLRDVTTTLADIQKELLDVITPHTILMGHSLNSDLNALKLTHPFLIDTGILFPHQRGPPYKQSLKWLAQKYLQKEIQKGINGHNSVEDARTCLDLVKQKCERGPRWGTSETNAESIFKRLGRALRPKSSSRASRAGAVIDWGDPNRGHGAQAQAAVGCESDSDVVQAIGHALHGQVEGKDGTAEKIDFVWGRLRELELARGWWDDGRTSEDVEIIRKAALERLGLPTDEEVEVTGAKLGDAVSRAVDHIVQIYDTLPRCTAFIVYSGTGDPRDVRRLQSMQQQHRREYQSKNWDQLSVKWTDTEVQALSAACKTARNGVGFITVK
ncbi:hypothetical protein K458DRAFT_390904 [Lentithecium fluviatile CBS 122367]|uniref:Exonuclease domain-containing protein n=1 Tax=Lentithecium fluviatile CBS 122367 TaxID=1168545 RepID=A0A6G1IWV4_9PLEO|nr:hypothetical protein K458DRAFT_390904 [Lentithecium fluviatile CBS 122367]